MRTKSEKVFAIVGLVRGRSWNFICSEQGMYLISYDGFLLETKLNELRGEFQNNKYKIVECKLLEPTR